MIRWIAYRRPDGVDACEARDAEFAGQIVAVRKREGCTGVVMGSTVERAIARHDAALQAERCRCCAGGTGALCDACQAAVLPAVLVASVAERAAFEVEAKRKAEEAAAAKAKADAVQAEVERVEKIERDAALAARLAATATDREKIVKVAVAIRAIKSPEIVDRELQLQVRLALADLERVARTVDGIAVDGAAVATHTGAKVQGPSPLPRSLGEL